MGEAETLPYVQVRGVTLTPAALTLRVGETAAVGLGFLPENASNRRYRVRVEGSGCTAVSEIGEAGFQVTGLAAGEAAVTVISLNGQKTAALNVSVQEE